MEMKKSNKNPPKDIDSASGSKASKIKADDKVGTLIDSILDNKRALVKQVRFASRLTGEDTEKQPATPIKPVESESVAREQPVRRRRRSSIKKSLAIPPPLPYQEPPKSIRDGKGVYAKDYSHWTSQQDQYCYCPDRRNEDSNVAQAAKRDTMQRHQRNHTPVVEIRRWCATCGKRRGSGGFGI